MDKYDVVLFDLDGTIVDSSEGITNSVIFALGRMGIRENNKDDLTKFIGPPLMGSFMKYYGFSVEEAETAIEHYRVYYRDKGIYENTLYKGIDGLIKDLWERKKTVLVATAKPEIFAKEILGYFNLSKYILYIAGSELDGTRTEKGQIIEYALEEGKITNRKRALMVGDRKHDIIGARASGIDSAGVLYGFGSYEELKGEGATYIVKEVEDLRGILF